MKFQFLSGIRSSPTSRLRSCSLRARRSFNSFQELEVLLRGHWEMALFSPERFQFLSGIRSSPTPEPMTLNITPAGLVSIPFRNQKFSYLNITPAGLSQRGSCFNSFQELEVLLLAPGDDPIRWYICVSIPFRNQKFSYRFRTSPLRCHTSGVSIPFRNQKFSYWESVAQRLHGEVVSIPFRNQKFSYDSNQCQLPR